MVNTLFPGDVQYTTDRHFRSDPLTGRRTLMLPDQLRIAREQIRQNRILCTPQTEEANHSEGCYCCPGHNHLTYNVISSHDADGGPVIAVTRRGVDVTVMEKRRPTGLGPLSNMRGNFGAAETIILGPDHSRRLTELTIATLATGLEVACERITDLSRIPELESILLWTAANSSGPLGYAHPAFHTEGLDFSFQRVIEEMTWSYFHYYTRNKWRCLMCDLLSYELTTRERVIEETANFIVLSPISARHPFELWFVPRNHYPSIESIGSAHPDPRAVWYELADLIVRYGAKLERLLGSRICYSFSLFNAPRKFVWGMPVAPRRLSKEEIDSSCHLRFRVRAFLFDRPPETDILGYTTNPIIPEEAARIFRMDDAGLDAWVQES